ncbi:hypothetical protein J2129_002127 [Methanofollis sp. W23]|nr:hypothetical protein [Methanofollis sp. W23]
MAGGNYETPFLRTALLISPALASPLLPLVTDKVVFQEEADIPMEVWHIW